MFGALIAEVGAGRAIVVTYINPVVAVLLGMAILGERPGPAAVAGLVLILVGSWLSTRRAPITASATSNPVAPRGTILDCTGD